MNKNPIIYLLIIFILTQCTNIKHKPYIIDSNREIKDIQIALVLGGGGSKGFAHLGAIAALEENHIPIDLIVGVSAGSAVGAFYADNQSITKTKEIIFKAKRHELLDFSFSDAFRMFSTLSSPVTGQAYESFIFNNLTVKNFKELKTPLVVEATY